MRAAAAVQEEITSLKLSGSSTMEAYVTKLRGQESAAESTREQKLANMNLAAETSLHLVKKELNNARLASADRARASAATASVSVQTAAESEASAMARRGKQLEMEAHQRASDAQEANSSTQVAAVAAREWRGKWPREEMMIAIGLAGEAANKTAPEMRDLAANAERIAALADDSAAQILAVIDEALEHAKHANIVARIAVDQAAQNSKKLKAIRQLVLDTEAAATASQVKSVSHMETVPGI